MLDLVDAGVVHSRRFRDLPLRIAEVYCLTDQAISLRIKRLFAADFVSYSAETGQRVWACHTVSSARRSALLIAIAPSG